MEGITPITLGTAQLGLVYGVANKSGKPDAEKAEAILEAAYGIGVRSFDTAAAYGDSERLLGVWIARRKREASVITKISAPPDGASDAAAHFTGQLSGCFERLGAKNVWAVLLHSYRLLERYGDVLFAILESLKQQRMIERIGCSVYTPEEATAVLGCPGFDVIQAPLNVFDHRFESSGALKRLSERGVTVFVRSVFLQGLLFLSPEEAESKVKGSGGLLQKFRRLCLDLRLTPAQLAYSYAAAAPGVSSIVLGAETKAQVDEFKKLLETPPLGADTRKLISETFSGISNTIIDPRLWPKGK